MRAITKFGQVHGFITEVRYATGSAYDAELLGYWNTESNHRGRQILQQCHKSPNNTSNTVGQGFSVFIHDVCYEEHNGNVYGTLKHDNTIL